MPLLSSQSGISAKALGLTSAQFSAFGDGYWGQLLTRTGATNYNASDSPSVDSSNNILFSSYYTDGNIDICTMKVNSSGVLQWQKKASTAQNDIAYGSTGDAAGNEIVVGISGSSGFGYVAKYDTSGNVTWAKDFIGSWTNVTSLGVKTDSSNNIYIVGSNYVGTTDTWEGFTVKLNSSGTVQWQRFIGGVGQQSLDSVIVDSSGNVYVTGTLFDSAYNTILFVKYNSSGTLQWQKKMSYSGASVLNGASAIDSSGYIYTAIYAAGRGVLIKFDSSGNVIWQKSGSTQSTQWLSIYIDSSDNIYVYGAVGAGYVGIVKYDTSGNVVFRRKLSGGYSGGVFAKGNGMYIYTITYGASTNGLTLYYLPSNGSKTGIYSIGGNTILYTGYDDIDISGAVSVATSTYTDTAGNFTFNTAAATVTTDTFTQTIQY